MLESPLKLMLQKTFIRTLPKCTVLLSSTWTNALSDIPGAHPWCHLDVTERLKDISGKEGAEINCARPVTTIMDVLNGGGPCRATAGATHHWQCKVIATCREDK